MSSAGMWTFSTLYAPRVRFDGACGSVWHAWVMCGRRIYVGREKLRFTRRNVRPRVTRLRACTTEGFCIFASFVLACTSVVDGPTYASVLCVTRTHGLHVYAPRRSVFKVTIQSVKSTNVLSATLKFQVVRSVRDRTSRYIRFTSSGQGSCDVM